MRKKPNKTCLPDSLKEGVENLLGFDMDDVKVNYNSPKPAQLNAQAYAQGNDIHLAAGQEKHLPHEAWHIVQQKQGRVKATKQMNGVEVNDDKGLEDEADSMEVKAMSLTILQMVKKYSVLICMVISVILIVIASTLYPGGSLLDKNSIGFDWSKNFVSNLFAPKAINGSQNPGRIWAIIGMAFHSVGYGIFFINMAKRLPSKPWATILKYIGIINIIFIFLIATPLHDLGTISIVLTLIGLFTITVFILKSKLHLLKFGSIICLLTFYCFFSLFGFGYMSLAIIMQKVYNVSSILLVLALEYFTKQEDFMHIKWGVKNSK